MMKKNRESEKKALKKVHPKLVKYTVGEREREKAGAASFKAFSHLWFFFLFLQYYSNKNKKRREGPKKREKEKKFVMFLDFVFVL
jgi:hypothetical protein